MKNIENADRPISAMEYSPSRRGPTRLSGSPAQTSLSSPISWSISVTQRSNHTFPPFRNPPSGPNPRIFPACGTTDSRPSLAQTSQMRFVRIEKRWSAVHDLGFAAVEVLELKVATSLSVSLERSPYLLCSILAAGAAYIGPDLQHRVRRFVEDAQQG